MKLTIKKEQLLTGLTAVQSVVKAATTLPILSNVLLKAEKGKLSAAQTIWAETLRQRGEWYLWRPSDWLTGRCEEVLG